MMKIIAQHVSSHSPIEALPSGVLDMDELDIDLIPSLRVAVGVRELSLVPPPVPGRNAEFDRRQRRAPLYLGAPSMPFHRSISTD
jgi:hypothetical protein